MVALKRSLKKKVRWIELRREILVIGCHYYKGLMFWIFCRPGAGEEGRTEEESLSESRKKSVNQTLLELISYSLSLIHFLDAEGKK